MVDRQASCRTRTDTRQQIPSTYGDLREITNLLALSLGREMGTEMEPFREQSSTHCMVWTGSPDSGCQHFPSSQWKYPDWVPVPW